MTHNVELILVATVVIDLVAFRFVYGFARALWLNHRASKQAKSQGGV